MELVRGSRDGATGERERVASGIRARGVLVVRRGCAATAAPACAVGRAGSRCGRGGKAGWAGSRVGRCACRAVCGGRVAGSAWQAVVRAVAGRKVRVQYVVCVCVQNGVAVCVCGVVRSKWESQAGVAGWGCRGMGNGSQVAWCVWRVKRRNRQWRQSEGGVRAVRVRGAMRARMPCGAVAAVRVAGRR